MITLPDIGQPFEGGFYGGQIVSHGGAKRLAVVWAPKADGETEGMWLPEYQLVPGTNCWHSMDNTRAMAAAGSPIAAWALDREIGGHRDWCIPARDVLELGYRHLKPTGYKTYGGFRDGDNPSSVPVGYPYAEALPVQTSVEAFREGSPQAFDEAWYWSSTQYSENYAWGQLSYYGYQLDDDKKFEGRVRLVRLIHLNP
ncbi:MAG: DUF1566 domain-containing protein [Hydrogenophaga sp.]|nr:DUF1566 domain-containing protein [Hydrogenophaga sp.]